MHVEARHLRRGMHPSHFCLRCDLTRSRSSSNVLPSLLHGSSRYKEIFEIKTRLENITITRQVAFLNTCISLVQCMSRVLISKLDIVLQPVIAILQHVEDADATTKNEDRSRLRQLVFKLLAEIWERYPDTNWNKYSPMYISILKNLVSKVPSMVTGGNSVPSLMLGLRAMSSSESLWFPFSRRKLCGTSCQSDFLGF